MTNSFYNVRCRFRNVLNTKCQCIPLTCFHTCTLSPGLKNILPITTAKVPIVKFYHIRTGLEGDISLYNTLVEAFSLCFFPPVSFCLKFPIEQLVLHFKTSMFPFRLYTTHTCWLYMQPSTGEWRSFVMLWRFLPKWVYFVCL